MSKIYLPTEYVDNCNVINNGYIRSYTNSQRTEWVDIYVNQDYMIRTGYSNYSNNITCDTFNTYTDNYYYRVDFPQIFTLFFLMTLFIYYIVSQCIKTLFRGWKRY